MRLMRSSLNQKRSETDQLVLNPAESYGAIEADRRVREDEDPWRNSPTTS
jgi:hypothetical protein